MLVHEPVDFAQHVRTGHLRVLEVETRQPDDAVGLRGFGGIADAFPAPVHSTAVKLGDRGFVHGLIAGKRLIEQFLVHLFFAVEPGVFLVRIEVRGVVDPVDHKPVDAGLRQHVPDHAVEVIEVGGCERDSDGAGKVVNLVRVGFAPVGVGADAEVAHDAHAGLVAQARDFLQKIVLHAGLDRRDIAAVPRITGTTHAERLDGVDAHVAVPLEMLLRRSSRVHPRWREAFGPPIEVDAERFDALLRLGFLVRKSAKGKGGQEYAHRNCAHHVTPPG